MILATSPKIGRWLLGGLLMAAAFGARGEAGGLYLGVAAAGDQQRFTYDKSVYTLESLARGEVTNNAGDADNLLWTLGVFAGYRWPLPGESGMHISAEADLATHPNKLKGHLVGTGYTWTDTWPEDWWLKRDRSYGLTLRMGGPFAGFRYGWHVLAGLRRVQTEFSITETGCPGPDLECPPTPLASFTEAVGRDFNARTLGVGLERRLSERLALQLDIRHTDHKRKKWDRLFEGGVIIPTEVEGRETTAAVRLVWLP